MTITTRRVIDAILAQRARADATNRTELRATQRAAVRSIAHLLTRTCS